MSADPLEFLPQTGPARLITGIRESSGALVCTARIPADSPFRSRDRSNPEVASVVAIEMAAQATAAMEPATRRLEGNDSRRNPSRLLVGLRAIELLVTHLSADDEYTCRATLVTRAGPLRIYKFEVQAPQGHRIANGELSTYFESEAAPE